MGKHSSDLRASKPVRRRASRPRTARVRALLSLGLVLGAATTGTFAYWTDQGVVSGASLTTGTLDLKLDNQDNITGYTSLSVANMIPGQSVAAVLAVQNAGTTNFTYTASTTATNSDGKNLRGALQVKVTGGEVSGTTCSGGTLTGTGTALNGGLVTTARSLAPSASENLCIEVRLPTSAANTLQSAATSVTMTFDAVQAP